MPRAAAPCPALVPALGVSLAASAEPMYFFDGVLGYGETRHTRSHEGRGLLDARVSASAGSGTSDAAAWTLAPAGTLMTTVRGSRTLPG